MAIFRPKKKKELESSIENKVVEYAKEAKFVHRKMNGLGNRNWPDQMFLRGNRLMFFIEFKRPGEEPTPAQAEMHKQLQAMGFVVYVCDNVEYGKAIIDAQVNV